VKLLFYGESAFNPTGFGNVNKHLLAACAEVCEVTHVATTHYHMGHDREEYPWDIVPCPDVSPEERTPTHQRNVANIEHWVKEGEWDIFFYQGDMGWNNDVLEWVRARCEGDPHKHSIFYMPIDGDISLPHAFSVFTWASAPVVYTHHARSVVARYQPEIAENISVIWLGCEPDVFYPLSREERRACRVKFFGEAYADRFIVLNVNRNQARKDLMRSIAAHHEFHKRHPDSTLMLHSVVNDVGGNLPFMAQLLGCDIYSQPSEVAFSSLDLAAPWSRSDLNRLYNACDVLISTAHGEGWGLTTTEAMSAGLPVVVPANTANLDSVGSREERGHLVRMGGDLDHTVFTYHQGNAACSIIHLDSFLEKLECVYSNRVGAMMKAQRAREWAVANSWEVRKNEWKQLLTLMRVSSMSTIAS